MKNSKTLYHFIIDRSGSMSGIMPQTINAYKDQLLKLASIQQEELEQQLFHSLTIFNDDVDHIIHPSRIDEPRSLSIPQIIAGGTTALLDAIGLSVKLINKRFGRMIENDEISIVVMTLTDGYENASRTFTYKEIADLITKLERTGKWSFSILGADIDIFGMAEDLKMSKENVIAFNKSDIHAVFSEFTDAMDDYIKAKRSGRIKKDFLDTFLIKDRRWYE